MSDRTKAHPTKEDVAHAKAMQDLRDVGVSIDKLKADRAALLAALKELVALRHVARQPERTADAYANAENVIAEAGR